MAIEMEQGQVRRVLRCIEPGCSSEALMPSGESGEIAEEGVSARRLVVMCDRGHKSYFSWATDVMLRPIDPE